MPNQIPHLDTLLNLETRHEDLLVQLDALDKRVLGVLKQWQPPSIEGNGQSVSQQETSDEPSRTVGAAVAEPSISADRVGPTC